MFNFIKEKIKKIYTQFTNKISALFSHAQLDENFVKELRTLLLSADTGVETTKAIIDDLTKRMQEKSVNSVEEAKAALEAFLFQLLSVYEPAEPYPAVMLLVGVNGTGKTTFAAKYAHLLKSKGKKVILVAGDTFRAAATEQLVEWGKRIDVKVFTGKEGQDPSSVIFDACQQFKEGGYDHLIIDTAGRLQTKVNLMRELEKIKRTIERQLGGYQIDTWLTIDSMIGQNSLQQAKLFYEATKVNGLILTKFDGTGKGGIVFAITRQLQLPIMYVTFGEGIDDIKVFDAREYVEQLFNE